MRTTLFGPTGLRVSELRLGTMMFVSPRGADEDASVERLRTDHVDVSWVHIRDAVAPVEEIISALDDAVRAGKVLHVGSSDFPAWSVSRADARGLTRRRRSRSSTTSSGATPSVTCCDGRRARARHLRVVAARRGAVATGRPSENRAGLGGGH